MTGLVPRTFEPSLRLTFKIGISLMIANFLKIHWSDAVFSPILFPSPSNDIFNGRLRWHSIFFNSIKYQFILAALIKFPKLFSQWFHLYKSWIIIGEYYLSIPSAPYPQLWSLQNMLFGQSCPDPFLAEISTLQTHSSICQTRSMLSWENIFTILQKMRSFYLLIHDVIIQVLIFRF